MSETTERATGEGEAAATRPERERRRDGQQSLRLCALTPSMTVDDLDRSMRFYVDALGFTVEDRWEDGGKLLGVMLVAGACRLGLSQDDWAKGRDRTKGVGMRLYAETRQDLDAFAARCRAQGVDVDGPKEEWGTRVVTLEDPDGFKLTVAATTG